MCYKGKGQNCIERMMYSQTKDRQALSDRPSLMVEGP